MKKMGISRNVYQITWTTKDGSDDLKHHCLETFDIKHVDSLCSILIHDGSVTSFDVTAREAI